MLSRIDHFACFLIFTHLARCAAAIFLRADADIVRLGFAVPALPSEALFAHRAFCARLIFLRPAAEIVRFTLGLIRGATVRAVRALIAASIRLRSSCNSLTIPSIDMGGIVAWCGSRHSFRWPSFSIHCGVQADPGRANSIRGVKWVPRFIRKG